MLCEGFSVDPAALSYKIRLTLHAKRRMIERKVGLEDVIAALTEPAQVYYDTIKDLYLVLGSNGVAVVIAFRGAIIELVTVLRRREYEALIGRLGSRRYKLIC